MSRLLKEALVGFELFFRLLFSKSDLIILSLPPFLSILIGSFVLILRRKQYVLDVRDLYPHVFIYQKLLSEKNLLFKIAMVCASLVHRKALFVTTVTSGLANEICTDFRIQPHKVILVRNGFDEESFHYLEKRQKTQAPLKIVMHGTLGRFQDVEGLIEIAKHLQHERAAVEFHVYGSGPKQNLFTNCPPNIVFHGEISSERIPDVLTSFDVGISLRLSDQLSKNSFPVKCYEYIGSGLPVISIPESEAGNIIENHSLGWQVTGTTNAVQLIQEMIKNPDLLAKTRANVIMNRGQFSRQQQSELFTNEVSKYLHLF